MKMTRSIAIASLLATLSTPGIAIAQRAEGGDNYRSFALSLPLVAVGGEATAKGEFNLKGAGGLAVVLNLMVESEVFSRREAEESNQDSMVVKGSEFGLVYSRYTRAKSMSGGYWAVGGGYRRMNLKWHRTPGEGFALVRDGFALDDENKVTHSLAGTGPSGHARIGYRFVGESLPICLGAHIGLRHFQSKFGDTDSAEPTANTTQYERDGLSRRFMTALEPGLEFGLAF